MREKVVMRITLAWWWRLYAEGLILVAYLFDREPDWEKVGYWTRRAIVVKATRSS